MKSILYLNKEKVFGNTPIWNKDTGKTLPLYCAPFTLSDQDYSKNNGISHDEIIYRLKVVISNKRYKWYNIHWASKIVLYWKE
jgi:hypothetical protein